MEQELKIRLLSLPDYEKVGQALGSPNHEAVQTNFYLDTPSLELQGQSIMARLREQKGRLRMTVKWGATHEGGYYRAEEQEADLRARTAEEALASGEAREALLRLCPPVRALDQSLDKLELVGQTRNLRKTYLLDGLELELDRTTFGPATEDWEIEIETENAPAAQKLIHGLLQKAGARGQAQTLTKYERFLQHQQRRET